MGDGAVRPPAAPETLREARGEDETPPSSRASTGSSTLPCPARLPRAPVGSVPVPITLRRAVAAVPIALGPQPLSALFFQPSSISSER